MAVSECNAYNDFDPNLSTDIPKKKKNETKMKTSRAAKMKSRCEKPP